jgi:hypothetical protein
MYRNKDYINSLTYFESAYDTENWSASYKEIRKEWMSTYFLLLLLIIVVLLVAVVLFFKLMGKINRKAAVSGKKKTFGQEIAYGFHVIFHPFDGFWDLKHEKRGSVRGSIFFIILAIATFYYQAIGLGYLLDPFGKLASVWAQVLGVLVPLFLFVLANWCLTTLFEGEGSFKDVFVASCYCLTPIILLLPLSTILTHFVTTSETGFITLINGICYVWLFLLLFFGTMTTHDFTLGKNIIMTIATVLCMAVIMFVVILFSSLLVKMFSFVSNIVTEISYRIS